MTSLYARLLLAGVILTIACGADTPAGAVIADRFDVALSVRADGSVEVHETIIVRLPDPALARFERRVSADQADGLTFVSASIDGRRLDPSQPGAERVVVAAGRRLDVGWHFQPSAASRAFELVYVATGAVSVRGNRGSLRREAVPGARGYAILGSRIELVIPEAAHLFDGTGIAEAGWTVARTSRGITAERASLDPAESGTVIAEFSVDRTVIAEPRWQFNEAWSQELVPAFISGGLFILVVGAGILWLIRFQYPGPRGGPANEGPEAMDRERRGVRAGLRAAGLVSVVLAVVTAAAVWLTLAHLGLWPMAVPVSILVVGIVFVAVSPWWV
jgi:hypothetical protein